VKMSNKH